MAAEAMRVLFLCTGNSARSQMAEALLRHLANARVDVVSAGSTPAPDVHPLTRATLKNKYGIESAALKPKPASDFTGQRFDAVITVCDAAAAACPMWPGAHEQIHWSIDDPAAVQGADAQRQAFENVARELEQRLRSWLSTPEIRRRLEAR